MLSSSASVTSVNNRAIAEVQPNQEMAVYLANNNTNAGRTSLLIIPEIREQGMGNER